MCNIWLYHLVGLCKLRVDWLSLWQQSLLTASVHSQVLRNTLDDDDSIEAAADQKTNSYEEVQDTGKHPFENVGGYILKIKNRILNGRTQDTPFPTPLWPPIKPIPLFSIFFDGFY